MQRPVAVCTAFKELKGSAAECTDQNCRFSCKSQIKRSSVDVTPTLGVNHVISGVMVPCVISVMICYA